MKMKTYPVQTNNKVIEKPKKKRKAWVRATTVRSEQYSFYERAKRRERRKLRQEIREYIDK